MAHFKRRRPRSQRTHGDKGRFPNGGPRWWDVVMNVRPWRRASKRADRDLARGTDPDEVLHPPHPHKPRAWYW